MGDVGGEGAREIETREIKSDDMTVGVASDAGPGAVAGDIPGGERRIGVVRDGGSERE